MKIETVLSKLSRIRRGILRLVVWLLEEKLRVKGELIVSVILVI